VQASLPPVRQARGPGAWIWVRLDPHVLLDPSPALRLQRQDQLKDIGVSFSVHHLLLDVDDDASVGHQDSHQLLGDGKEPDDVVIRRHSAVRLLSSVGVGR